MTIKELIEAKKGEAREQLKTLLDDPRTGLRQSSDTNKTRYAAFALLETSLDAIAEAARKDAYERVLEVTTNLPYDVAIHEAAKYGNESVWKQPYAGNRMMQLGWKIADKLKEAITTLSTLPAN